MRTIAALTALCLTAIASADPPCNRVVPIRHQRVFPHAIHAPTIYQDTHLNIVEVPTPAYFFQTLTAYQPPAQVQAPAPVQQIQQASDGIGTNESLAALLGSQPPAFDPVAEISQKCASCHSLANGKTKGGLSLFNKEGQFAPTSSKQIDRSIIAARTRSLGADAMPPGADTNPAKRLSDAAIQYLETGQ